MAAAVEAQRSLAGHAWPPDGPIQVRMGMHTGEGHLGGDDYVGVDVHRAARVAAAGHGGQVLVSDATRALVADGLADGVELEDLGQHRLKDFDEPQRLHQLIIEGLNREFGPLKTADVLSNLPAELTSFVGREREVEEISGLLNTARLITLTGPGGTGKTRLAVAVAARVGAEFRDGVFFVDLSAATDPSLVPSEMARAVGVQEQGERSALDILTAYLAERSALLVPDNFEQVLAAASDVEALLTAARQLRVLCTSREPLHLYGEREFPVPPLELPDPTRKLDVEAVTGNESVSLFVERARAVRPGFSITEGNAQAVAEICARLDGLPLAIELAASRVKVLTPASILERLRAHRPVLATGGANVPARQQTLRNAIAWSYDLLPEPERTLLARLSVFSGGWTLEGADAVANPSNELVPDTLDALASLVDKSLVRQTGIGEETRFAMLETIREFSTEVLEQEDPDSATRRRHAEHFLGLAEEAEPYLESEDQATWLDRIEREHDNIRTALRWAIDTAATELAQGMAAALWRFWYQHGHLSEGATWLDEALHLPGTRDATRAKAHIAAGGIAYWRLERESISLHYEEALAISRELGDRRGEMEALFNLGFVPMVAGDHRASVSLWNQAAAIARELGDREMLARSIQNVGTALLLLGDLAAAVHVLEEVKKVWEGIGNKVRLGEVTAVIGDALHRMGDPNRAHIYFRNALELLHEAGNMPLTAAALDGLAQLASALGHHERAMRLTGAATGLKEWIGGAMPVSDFFWVGDVSAARAAMGAEAADAAIANGRAMSLEQAVAYALSDES